MEKKQSSDKASTVISSSGQLKTDKPGSENRNLKTDNRKGLSLIDKEISLKTFIVSHFLLLIFGLALLFGMYYYIYKTDASDDWRDMAPLTQNPKSLTLDINSPSDEDLVFDKNLIISGSTLPNAVLVITVNGVDLGLESNKKGDFSKIVSLSSGVNNLTISALDNKGGSKTVEKVIYFSEEKI